jgi:hypothetical protein
MHEHLGKLRTMGLILRLREYEVHGAANTVCVFRDQQRTLAGSDAVRDPTPECNGAIVPQRTHETYRRATVDAIAENGS